jgi:hypothetical protein
MNRKNKEIVEQQRLKKTQLERKLAELTTREVVSIFCFEL